MGLLAPFILQNFFLKILELIQSYQDKQRFRDQNGQFVLINFFWVPTTVITFIYLLALFIVQNLKFFQRIQNYDDTPFLGPNWSICPKLFLESYYYHCHLPISPFHCEKCYKNSCRRSRVIRMCNFWAQNGPFPQMKIFSENLLMSLISFIHAYYMLKIKVRY